MTRFGHRHQRVGRPAFQENVGLEPREPGCGVAIIPSALRTSRYKVRIFGVTYRGKPLREQLLMLWDKRRPLPHYATSFCEMLAEHFRAVFPISRPNAPERHGLRGLIPAATAFDSGGFREGW